MRISQARKAFMFTCRYQPANELDVFLTFNTFNFRISRPSSRSITTRSLLVYRCNITRIRYWKCRSCNVHVSLLVFWRNGSVVRTLVFGWQTFCDLCLIYGWHVTTSLVVSDMGQPTRPTQPSIHQASVNEWIARVETIKQQTRAAYCCLVAGQSSWARA